MTFLPHAAVCGEMPSVSSGTPPLLFLCRFPSPVPHLQLPALQASCMPSTASNIGHQLAGGFRIHCTPHAILASSQLQKLALHRGSLSAGPLKKGQYSLVRTACQTSRLRPLWKGTGAPSEAACEMASEEAICSEPQLSHALLCDLEASWALVACGAARIFVAFEWMLVCSCVAASTTIRAVYI